jgi:hypothetical protein
LSLTVWRDSRADLLREAFYAEAEREIMMVFQTRSGRLATAFTGLLVTGVAAAATAQSPLGPGSYTQNANTDTYFTLNFGGLVEPGSQEAPPGTPPNSINDESYITFVLPAIAPGTKIADANFGVYLEQTSSGAFFTDPGFSGDLYAGYGAAVSASDPTYDVGSTTTNSNNQTQTTFTTAAGSPLNDNGASIPIGQPQESNTYVTSVTPLPNTGAAPDLSSPNPNGPDIYNGTAYNTLPETVNYSLVQSGFLQPSGNGKNNPENGMNQYVSITTSTANVSAAQAALSQVLNNAEASRGASGAPVYVTITVQPNTPLDTSSSQNQLSAYLFGILNPTRGTAVPEKLSFDVVPVAAPEPGAGVTVSLGVAALGGLIFSARRVFRR